MRLTEEKRYWNEMEVKFGKKLFRTKLLYRLSHKVCRLLPSPVLLRKFTDIHYLRSSDQRGKFLR